MKSNLLKDNEDLMKEYDYEKNINIDLNKIAIGSGKKVWWTCPVGHSYDQTIILKSSGIKCPICANRRIEKGFNDVATTNPELLKEWNYHKNISISPYNIGKGSGKKYGGFVKMVMNGMQQLLLG